MIKQLAERYKEICRSPFADGYTFTAFDGECAKKGFTRDDIKNYIEKEKQERKAKRTENIKSLKEQLKAKEQECEKWKNAYEVIEDALAESEEYCEELEKQLKRKEQECEELKKDLHQNFEEKDKLHLIIDRLLEASGYDTNTASAEEFEDVYEHMRYEQQQLDQLKEQLEAYKMEAEEGKEINAELKAELEQEKALKETYLTCYRAKHEDIEGELFKLKQTLTEIKEIAECLITMTDEYDSCYYKDRCSKCEVKEDCQYIKIEQILQKISEVEDE